ncbi:MAG: disulfide oxidoreductase [Chloroflexota bacterium]|nr:disulfide oxidoreductase [Chloroflexota bacterium]MDE2930177.1 disulfide oxidoreductase [Chloroflexota bacterium]
MWSVSQALATLTLIAYAAVALCVIVGIWERAFFPNLSERVPRLGQVRAQVQDSALGLAWIVALVATLGSLYLSEIANYPPCTLCWLQRIAMYPLVVLLGIGALREDRAIGWYALPLAGIGAALAFYHALVQRVPGLQQATSCSAEAPCNAMWVREFGFVSIPVMALGAFLLIGALILVSATAAAGDVAAERRSPRRR